MSHATDKIRNVAIAGHGSTGKTTLFEHLLFAGGAISKAEPLESGKTAGDYRQEEIDRKISIYAAMGHVERNGTKINLFDTPGSSDFNGEVILSFRASEFALLAVDGRSGVQIETVKLWRNLDGSKKPRGVFVTKLDDDKADFGKVLADIKEKFNIYPVPLTLPMGKGGGLKGVIDVLHDKAYLAGGSGAVEKECPIPDEYKGDVDAAREKLIEAAAEGDDDLMEKYLEQGTLSIDEMKKGLVGALARNKYVPAFAGAALANAGLVPLIDFIVDAAPGPAVTGDSVRDGEGNEQTVAFDSGKPFAALVIKTTYDQFSGKLSWLKIVSGKLSADSEAFNVSEGKKERIGKIYTCQGKNLEEAREFQAGDIGIVTKSATLKTNHTLAATDGGLKFVPLHLPTPVHSVAVNAVAKKDEDKLGEFLTRTAEEDKTFKYKFNGETKEMVISGMGELQVGIILDRLKTGQKVEIEMRPPKVAYRETITKKAEA